MKRDEFKVKWCQYGWGIHRKALWIFWLGPIKGRVWQFRATAEDHCKRLNEEGIAPESWFESD